MALDLPHSYIARVPLSRGKDGQPRRDRWVYVSLVPLGFGAWAPIIAGVRCRIWWWSALGWLWTGTVVVAIALAGGHGHHKALGGALLWGGWLGAVITSFAIRPAYERHRGFSLGRSAWPAPTPRSLQWSMSYVIAAFVATFLLDLGLAVLFRDIFRVHVIAGVAVLATDATLLLGVVPLSRRGGLSVRDLGIRPTLALPSLGLVILGGLTYLVLGDAYSLAFISNSTRHSEGLLSGVNNLGTAATIATVVAIAVSAPVVEEIFFRGLLYRGLRNRLPVIPATVIAGCIFGFVHITGYPLITLPIKAGFGVIACLIYERTGSLLPGMALHAFVDASSADIALTGNDYAVLAVAGTAIVLVLLWAGIKTWRENNGRAAAVPTIQPVSLGSDNIPGPKLYR
jgi:hypothetical protein